VLQAIDPRPGSAVLEVGLGSGYLAALLRAAGATRVIGIELIPALAAQARRNLNRADVSGVVVLVGDGRRGIPEGEAFDAVVISAATEGVPPALLSQVVDGGKLVAPLVGPGDERLWCLTRQGSAWSRQDLGECRFVPLLGDQREAATRDGPSGLSRS
jgi:protein-L-isoaspartate(D-aspartate) O-methyltransferase